MRAAPKSGLDHGTHNAYSNYGCRCDECRDAERAYRQERGMTEYQRAWKARNRDRTRAYSKKYRDTHPESRSNHYQANRERTLAQNRDWAQRNPDVVRTIGQRKAAKRRALLAAVETFHITATEWKRLCSRYRHRCAYCGCSDLLTMDHVVPITRGGRHAIGNLVPACLSCNASKGTLLLSEWRMARAA